MLDKKEEDKIGVVVEEQEKKEIKLIGSQRTIKGLILWEVNINNNTYKKAKFEHAKLESKDAVNSNSINIRRKVVVNEGCVYIQCLNEKSLLKKLKKWYKNEFNKASE